MIQVEQAPGAAGGNSSLPATPEQIHLGLYGRGNYAAYRAETGYRGPPNSRRAA